MSEDDVWSAESAALAEDYGEFTYDAERAVEFIKIDYFLQWGIKAIQTAPVPLLLGGAAVWLIGLAVGFLAQIANLGSTLAAAAPGADPIAQQALSTVSQTAVQFVAAPVIWVAAAAVGSAAAKVVAYNESQWSAIVPSASSILAVIVVNIGLIVLIQVPLVCLLGVGGGIGYVAGGSDPEMQLLFGAGGLFAVLLLLLPALLYLGLRLAFAVPAAIVEGSGVEGIKRSWQLTRGGPVLLHLFLFALVQGGLGLANVLFCCCLGLPSVLIVPFSSAALTAVYLRATRTDDVLDNDGFFAEL